MSWYSIDAVKGAFDKTKNTLIEPFNFWKWIKLGLIIFLMGGSGGGGSNFNIDMSNQQFRGKDITGPSTAEIISHISQFWHQYMIYILIIAGLIVLIMLLFACISSLMEFVFVDSLVTNMVEFWAYSRKYLRLGFNLFIIRLILGLSFLSLLFIALLPILMPVLKSPDTIGPEVIIGGILWFFAVVFVLAIVSGIIESFINLSIPLAMYSEMGIIAAFKKIFGTFIADWKQIIVYWVVRFILRLVAGIIVGIVALILFIIIFGVLAVLDVILYYILSNFGLGFEDIMFWIVLIPVGVVELILFLIFILMVSVPAPVFLKYHMLTFLQAWYPDARIPFSNMIMSQKPKG